MADKIKSDTFHSKEKIGERLKTAREIAKMTQVKLAETANIARTSIVHYEQGNVVPGSLELIRLAKALNISPNYILSGSDEFFSSNSLEEIIATSDESTRIAIISICMKTLDREISEDISRLIISLVKTKLNKTDFQELQKYIQLIAGTMSQMGPDIEGLADRAIEKRNLAGTGKKKAAKKKHGK